MKTLLLLRHAKSSWDDEGLDDHDRPLNKRGKKAAPRMGEWLQEKDIVPGLIIASTAKRAKKTALLAAKAAGYEGDVLLDPKLYLAPPERYVFVASKVGDEVDRLMLVGHNPGIEMCVGLLCGGEDTMPTGALAMIAVPVSSWAEFTPELDCKLEALWRPKELP